VPRLFALSYLHVRIIIIVGGFFLIIFLSLNFILFYFVVLECHVFMLGVCFALYITSVL